MHDLSEFTGVIRRYIEVFDRLIPLEQRKLDVVRQNRVSQLEEIGSKEQAEALAMRGLEQKREKAQEALGFQGLTFQEILEKLPVEQKQDMKALFNELAEKVRAFQSLSDSSRSIMEVNLHTINKMIAEQKQGKGQTYSEDGSVKTREIHFTDTRI